MSEVRNIPGHVLHYKVIKSDGTFEWVPIPAVVNAETVYDFYKQYCIKNNITPVTEDVYDKALAMLPTIQETAEALGQSTQAIEDLTTALSGGVLPLSLGGTGFSIGDTGSLYSTMCEFILYNLGFGTGGTTQTLPNKFKTLSDNVASLSNNKLDKTSISSGTANPTSSTSGTIYFQYKA